MRSLNVVCCFVNVSQLFRCGVAPIRLETGQYENLPEEQRLCPMCDSQAIESEIHVLIKCNLYILFENRFISYSLKCK